MNAPHATEHELADFLQDPASYPHRPSSVRLVQTHISLVAVAPPFVYKVKKAVDFGFLDYATLDRRRHFCEREVAINRRLCADVYEGVVPIRRAAGRLSFGGDGPPVEFAVKMRELPADGFLDRRLARGADGNEAIDRVADRLVAFYRGRTSTPEIAAWGDVERLRISTDENFAQTADGVGDALPRATWEALRAWTDAYYRRHADRFRARVAEGRIVDAHGDLRAEHVHLSDAGVRIYDAIEFSDRLRCIDVASDVAFLAMDLRRLGHPHLARRLARRVSAALGDPGLVRLVPFYGAYRAFVRGKVALLRSAEPDVAAGERAACRASARRHFALALTYAAAGEGPAVVAVTGGVGTGKSTVAEGLGELLAWEVVSSDRVRKALAGVPHHHRGTAAERARLYAPEATERTYGALRDRALANARAGQGTILDATYGRRRHRDALRRDLARAGVPCVFVELAAPEPVVRARLAARAGHRRVVSDARLEDAGPLAARYEAPGADEGVPRVGSGARSVAATLRDVLDAVLAHGVIVSAHDGPSVAADVGAGAA